MLLKMLEREWARLKVPKRKLRGRRIVLKEEVTKLLGELKRWETEISKEESRKLVLVVKM